MSASPLFTTHLHHQISVDEDLKNDAWCGRWSKTRDEWITDNCTIFDTAVRFDCTTIDCTGNISATHTITCQCIVPYSKRFPLVGIEEVFSMVSYTLDKIGDSFQLDAEGGNLSMPGMVACFVPILLYILYVIMHPFCKRKTEAEPVMGQKKGGIASILEEEATTEGGGSADIWPTSGVKGQEFFPGETIYSESIRNRQMRLRESMGMAPIGRRETDKTTRTASTSEKERQKFQVVKHDRQKSLEVDRQKSLEVENHNDDLGLGDNLGLGDKKPHFVLQHM